MFRSDLVLLHPPSVYDFRKKTIMYGPISDLIPSTPIFEMYPVGFMSIAEYLERAGYRVRIVNLALRMLNSPDFDAEKMIRGINSPAFGIDLHWLPHAHGAIEVAKLVKKYHPNAAVIVGGLSASYYYRELFNYPEIDYVIRGDSTEEPFRQLMDCIMNKKMPLSVPNLVWRDGEGEVRENPLCHVPSDLEDVMVRHYDHTLRSVLRHRDLANYIPFKRWTRYPIMAVLTCRGCTQNCILCGGSASAFRHICGRNNPAFRSPESVAQDIEGIQRFSKGPIFILGDIRQPGEDYAERLLWLLNRQRLKNQVIVELFTPASADFLRKVGQACPGFCLEISPESHDPVVRQALGKHYSNQALEEAISGALAAGCQRLDVFFMIGLPRQSYQSVMATVDYCESLLSMNKSDGTVTPFIAPLSPFLDPGSLAFEHPERYGYRLFCHSLEEHRQALLSPSWKYMLNYETEWMTRDEIVASTYEAALRLTRLKARYGLISSEVAQATEHHVEKALEVLHRIDDIMSMGDSHRQEQELSRLKAEVEAGNIPTLGEKTELELPVGAIKLNPLRALWSVLTGR